MSRVDELLYIPDNILFFQETQSLLRPRLLDLSSIKESLKKKKGIVKDEREIKPQNQKTQQFIFKETHSFDLPTNFTYGVIEQHGIARGGEKSDDVTGLKYPGHQHMHEWYLFLDLARPEIERVGSSIVRVFDPVEADLFYVAVFSSLSLIVNSGRPGFGYSDEEMQESLVGWLEGQEWWRRNNGRDHVIVAGDPNALKRVMDRVKNALVKDVIIPYSHRIDAYEGELGVKQRNNLLFFMGNRYRKDVSLNDLHCS